MNNEFGPREIQIKSILTNSLGTFISGFVGSILIIILIFVFGGLNIAGNLAGETLVTQTNGFFPLIFSMITLIGTSISCYLGYIFLTAINTDRYKRTGVQFAQISIFLMLTYLFITPAYLMLGMQSYTNIILVFIAHILLVSFGTSLILEILNNYRYILVGVYGSFFALFCNILLVILVFSNLSDGTAKLILMIILLPIINGFIVFCKELFELLYYSYYKATGIDPIGDIFYQIELEEKEQLDEAIQSNI